MTWLFWLYAVGAALWGGCAAVYGLRSPWWRSAIGRSLFGSWTSIALVLTLAALFRVAHLPHPLAVALAAGMLTAVALAGLVQLVTVVWLQQRRDPGEPHRRATDHR